MRRPLRRPVPTARLLLVAAALLGIALSTTIAGRADAQTGSSTTPRLTLVSQTDWVGPESVYRVVLQPAGLPTGATVTAVLHEKASSRSTLEATASGQAPGRSIFTVADRDPVAELSTPDGRIVVSLPVTTGSPTAVDLAPLPNAGVYPFDIQVFDAENKVVAELVTTLLRLGEPGSSSAPSTLGVGVMVPIVAAVVPGLDNSPTLDDAGADHLANTIAAVAARPDVPMTLTPSAESLFLLDERDAAAGSATDGQLQAGAGRQVLAGPYAPIDTGSWIDSGLVGEMDDQYVMGTKTLQGLLHSAPDGKAAVLDRTVSPSALDHLRTLGVQTVVAPSDQLTHLADPAANANFAQQFDIATSDGTTVRAVVGDTRTAARLGRGEDPVLAGHQALAELACLSLPMCGSQPGVTGQRGVAVSVPATTDPIALTTFLNGLADPAGAGNGSAGEPMVAPQTLDRLVITTTLATGRNRSTTLVRGYEADAPADLGRYPSDLRSARGSFAGLENLVPETPTLTGPVDHTLLSSGARNLDADQRAAMVGAARDQIGAVTEQIVVTPEQIVTLTSSSGKVPLNLENRLQYPASVRIVLNSAKLDFPEGSVIEETLAPAQTTTINLPVETRASGAFPLNVTISSADGTLPVATTRYTVRSTAISGIGLMLSIGAGLFLLIWWARHFRTARRARKLVGSSHPTLSGADPDGYAPPDTDPMEGR